MDRINFSLQKHPEKDKISMLQEVYAPILAMDLECKGGDPYMEMTGLSGESLSIAVANVSPHLAKRTANHIANIGDDWIFSIALAGRVAITVEGGSQKIFAPGEAFFGPAAAPWQLLNLKPMSQAVISIPRHILHPRVPDLDSVLMRKIDQSSSTELQLLTAYLRTLIYQQGELSGPSQQLAATHIHDLVTLLLNGESDYAELARGRGLGAARLKAIKADVATHLHSNLNIEAVAARHHISPQYVRKLFRDSGTTFSDHVTEQRLEIVYRQLRNPLYTTHSITTLVYQAGFNNISWFNRAFKRRYGMTPSEARRDCTE